MNTHTQVSAATCKVLAPSSRQALRLLRERLGPDALVLSNRVTADGVEIVATTEEAVARMTAPAALPVFPGPAAAHPAPMLRPATMSDGDSVLREIHSMRGMIEEQLAGMAWNEKQRRDPVRGHLLRTLLGAGFSARLAKDLLNNLPTGHNHADGMDHVKAALARQLPLLESEDALMDAGGVYALTGPTGVGKTTTTAKLAARCMMRFGPGKLALVTTDSYRIGAYEQLRIYGQILGVPVHAVKDAADLELVLADLRDKHMVLIDTVGMSQRDRAVSDQLAMLCGASRPVKRLLLLNASSHGDTLNEVVRAYRHGEQAAGSTDLAGCIFTKVDEATHPGALIDIAIRHQLPVHYISSGQKVPEHLMLVDPSALIDSVFQAKSPSAWFVPREADLEEPLANDESVAAAEAVNERLRSQCQQLIRALAHNAQELAANATALATGQLGFEETRALWRQLYDEHIGWEDIAQTLHTQASADIRAGCDNCVLAITREINLAPTNSANARVLSSTLLLSDRSGLPFAAPRHDGVQLQNLGKPVIHLFAQMPGSEQMREWQSSGLQWAACGTAALRIVKDNSGAPDTLAKLAARLSFTPPQAITYRRKSAWLSVSEALVRLRPDQQDGAVGAEQASSPLRCVVTRMVDPKSGELLAQSYLLASTGIQVTAQQMAQWPAWRTAATPYFRLFERSIVPLGDGGQPEEAAMLKRFLIAGQACTTVFRLQRAQDAWAETARKVLAQLAGRSVRPGRPVPGSALLEGLGKLFVLLDALETDTAALSTAFNLAQAQDQGCHSEPSDH